MTPAAEDPERSPGEGEGEGEGFLDARERRFVAAILFLAFLLLALRLLSRFLGS